MMKLSLLSNFPLTCWFIHVLTYSNKDVRFGAETKKRMNVHVIKQQNQH